MFLKTAALIVVLIGIPLLLSWLARGGKKLNLEREARIRAARPMKAKVLEVKDTAVSLSGARRTPMVHVTLELTPEGGEPYTAQASWWVRSVGIPMVQPGKEVAVRVDLHNRHTVYPDFEEAWHAWDLGGLGG